MIQNILRNSKFPSAFHRLFLTILSEKKWLEKRSFRIRIIIKKGIPCCSVVPFVEALEVNTSEAEMTINTCML